MAARFYDAVGYGVTQESESAPGVWEDVITERNCSGDVLRNTRKMEEGAKVNNDLSVGSSISILAHADVQANFFNIKYVKWLGTYWTVTNVDVEHPRLILRLGAIYNGKKAKTTPNP